MSRKSKQLTVDQSRLIDLLARDQLAKQLRPTLQEWSVVSGIPERTVFRQVDERIEEIKKERGLA